MANLFSTSPILRCSGRTCAGKHLAGLIQKTGRLDIDFAGFTYDQGAVFSPCAKPLLSGLWLRWKQEAHRGAEPLAPILRLMLAAGLHGESHVGMVH